MIIIFCPQLLHLLGAQHFQRAVLGHTTAFEIHAADELLVSGRELLLHDQFVSVEDFSLFVHVRGFELNLIVRELVAIIAESDNPGWFRSRQLRTEFRTGDHDIPGGIRTPNECHQAAAVLPDSENQNDSDKKQPSRNDPLAGPQELQHLPLLPWQFLQRDLEIDFPVPAQNSDGDPFTGFIPIDLGR